MTVTIRIDRYAQKRGWLDNKRVPTDVKPCKHLVEVAQLMQQFDIGLGGCSCCENPYITCNACEIKVASAAVEDILGLPEKDPYA